MVRISGPGTFPSTRIPWAENEILGICLVASEVIIEIFDKSSLVKTDNCLFHHLQLGMTHQNDPFVSFLYRTKTASYYFEKIL